MGQLRRILISREAAVKEIAAAVDNGDRANENQLKGELLLAYASQVPVESVEFSTSGYEGEPIEIVLDPEKSAIQNANQYFEKAKKAKRRLPVLRQQLELIAEQCIDIGGSIQKLEAAETLQKVIVFRKGPSPRNGSTKPIWVL